MRAASIAPSPRSAISASCAAVLSPNWTAAMLLAATTSATLCSFAVICVRALTSSFTTTPALTSAERRTARGHRHNRQLRANR
ncbi:MAG: hypothetical protein QM736_20355 [Vicinamibacterales bacterium]